LTSESELWQMQRRLVQPLFTRGQVAAYAERMSTRPPWARAGDRATADGGVVDAHVGMVRVAPRVVPIQVAAR
jgi:cytochrome P450